MSKQEKTFEVDCPACKRPFHIRRPLANPEAEGAGDISIECMYCRKKVMVTLPRQYLEKGSTLKEDE